MKKVLYVITSPAHKRVFESFVERLDLEQLIIGPAPSESRFVPEDYSDFKLKNIRYYKSKNYSKEINEIVSKFKPDIYVQADMINAHKEVSGKFKRVYVSHGMVGNHVKGIIKQAGFELSAWKGFDLYCGATKVFADWVKHVAKVDDSKILLNALPQLDILYNQEYYNSYKQKILQKTKFPNPKRVVLFAGFCCRDRYDFINHNEDYFRTAITLGKLAEQENWLVMIKPRQVHSEMIKFLKSHGWGKKYINEYQALQENKYVHFITAADAHIYRYYFADAFVVNGCSTVEIEACAIQKPLFVVRTHLPTLKEGYDPYNTVKSGAAMGISDLAELEHCLRSYFYESKYHWPEKQKQLLEDIDFDGKHHERIQNRLVEL